MRDKQGKNSILLEGAPGLGKSTLFRAVLEAKGFRQDATDPLKKYVLLAAGGPVQEALDVIQKAYEEGVVMILDELNVLDPAVEELLLHLLGRETRSHFLILASQNASDSPSCEVLSPALRNRFCLFHLDPYTDESLEKLATQKMGSEGQFLFKAYQSLRQSGKKQLTVRTFFKAMPEEPVHMGSENVCQSESARSVSESVGLDQILFPFFV